MGLIFGPLCFCGESLGVPNFYYLRTYKELDHLVCILFPLSRLDACLKLIVAWVRERGLIFHFSVPLVVMEGFHCGIWKWMGEWGRGL